MDLKDFEKIEKEIQEKKKEKEVLLRSIKELSDEKISLLNEITQTRNDIKDIHESRKTISRDKDELNAQKKILLSEITAAKKKLTETKDAYQEQLDNLLSEEKRIDEKINYARRINDETNKSSLEIVDIRRALAKERMEIEILKKQLSQKIGELNDSVDTFNRNNKGLNELLEKSKKEMEDYQVKAKKADEKEQEFRLLEKAFVDKVAHAEGRIKALDEKEEELKKREVSLNTRDAQLDNKNRAIDNIQRSLDVSEKQLKIKQLRVDELIRINGIEKELKTLEEQAKK